MDIPVIPVIHVIPVETRSNVSLRGWKREWKRERIRIRIRYRNRKRERKQLNNLGNPQKIQFQPLYDHSNQPQQNKLTKCAKRQCNRYGNEIILNMSFAMIMN